ncbi:hypothetical protein EYF80_047510 [Liparis tanakae]|uniref:Uncharacterized protein n=1 Tax=Liparis tanakae TaxID=230148 RepID=A0A4Z2FMF9_9TELE|nr:hypothetical protein EYF80_047510 [Liparis tanakae]
MSNDELLSASLPAVMDGLRWEGNTSLTLAISSIHRDDEEKRIREDSRGGLPKESFVGGQSHQLGFHDADRRIHHGYFHLNSLFLSATALPSQHPSLLISKAHPSSVGGEHLKSMNRQSEEKGPEEPKVRAAAPPPEILKSQQTERKNRQQHQHFVVRVARMRGGARPTTPSGLSSESTSADAPVDGEEKAPDLRHEADGLSELWADSSLRPADQRAASFIVNINIKLLYTDDLEREK